MTPRLKIFLIVFVLSLPFWWGANLLEKNLKDFFFLTEISKNPRIFTAQLIEESYFGPIRQKDIEEPAIEAKSAISVFLNEQGQEKILFEKNTNEKLPIASLTKLMTAKVVLQNYDLSKEIEISEESIGQEEDFGKLEEGKVFEVKYLLYPLLMESSNDAAFALANDYEEMTEEKFVEIMNAEARELNLNSTFFVNSTGLDPDDPEKGINYSTAVDLTNLAKHLLEKPLIWEILSSPKFDLYGPVLINTDKLLDDASTTWKNRILGGKTGYTDQAGGCLLLVLKTPRNNGYIINVILGADDRFGEMKKLVDWLNTAYKW